MIDPETENSRIFNSSTKLFQDFNNFQCLIMLGEPGTGKSSEIEQLYQATFKTKNTMIKALKLDAKAWQHRLDLQEDLITNSVVTEWKNIPNSILFIYIDSLDECLLRMDTITEVLKKYLSDLPLSRLYLRLACRSANWPNHFETELKELFNNSLEVIQIAPLRQKDVIIAASAVNISSDLFLAEVYRKKAVPFSTKPITLIFLLKKFQISNILPKTQTELYLDGCTFLCDEINPGHKGKSIYSKTERLLVAARIAALTIFTNKLVCWTSSDLGDLSPNTLHIEDITGGYELVNNQKIAIREPIVKETLSTGLFCSYGENQLGWVHKSYAEFLAAYYLSVNQVSLSHILKLTTYYYDHRVFPSLSETCAWLAAFNQEVFNLFIVHNPDILLNSDITTSTESIRETLVYHYLESIDNNLLYKKDLETYYYKLSHSNLSQQLDLYIHNPQKPFMSRREAIKIGIECNVWSKFDSIIDLAFDRNEPTIIRYYAIKALTKSPIFNFSETIIQLLASLSDDDDLQDELRGICLQALWPHYIDAEILFSYISPRKRTNFFGHYYLFLKQNLCEGLNFSHLPAALTWLKHNTRHLEYDSHLFKDICDFIYSLAWQNFAKSLELKSFIEATLKLIKEHITILNSGVLCANRTQTVTDEQRHQLLYKLIENLDSAKEIPYFSFSGITNSTDVPWLISHFVTEIFDDKKQIWAKLISEVTDTQNTEDISLVYYTFLNSKFSSTIFRWLFAPVDLSSDFAVQQKEMHYKRLEWEKPKNTNLIPPPQERISILLDKFEDGDLSAWWKLNRELTLTLDSTDYGDEIDPNMTELPGWQNSTPQFRDRIVAAAKKYVNHANPKNTEWFCTNTFYFPAAAGFRALYLLAEIEPAFLEQLLSCRWSIWTPIILSYPVNEKHKAITNRLIKYAYLQAHIEFIDRLEMMILKSNEENNTIFILNYIDNHTFAGLDNKDLANSILNLVKMPDINGKVLEQLITFLIVLDKEIFLQYAQSIITLPLDDSYKTTFSPIVAKVLSSQFQVQFWPQIWETIKNNESFGANFIQEISSDDIAISKLIPALTEYDIADLYIELETLFPIAEDPKHEFDSAAYWVSPRDAVADFRRTLLEHLKLRGTEDSCIALEKIQNQLPNYDWLKYTVLAGKEIKREKSWCPLDPASFKEIILNPKINWINNGEELLENIIEVLQDFQSLLQGETPLSPLLWNISDESHFPKDENILSDFLKVYLEQRLQKKGIFIKREVEIYRLPHSPMGKRTDIYIDTYTEESKINPTSHIVAIIEVKGCWNNALHSSMHNQLLNDYLIKTNNRFGLYVVGYFNCSNCFKKNCPNKNKLSNIDLDLSALAKSFSDNGFFIKSIVLDLALPTTNKSK